MKCCRCTNWNYGSRKTFNWKFISRKEGRTFKEAENIHKMSVWCQLKRALLDLMWKALLTMTPMHEWCIYKFTHFIREAKQRFGVPEFEEMLCSVHKMITQMLICIHSYMKTEINSSRHQSQVYQFKIYVMTWFTKILLPIQIVA